MKILAGVYTARQRHRSTSTATRCRSATRSRRSAPASSTVFQEFNLLPERTIAENICLGREPGAAASASSTPAACAATPRSCSPASASTGLKAGTPRAQPLGRRAAGRRDRQGGQLRRQGHPDGRADRGAGRPRGRAPLLDHRVASQAAASPSSTSRTGSRRSSTSARPSPSSRTASTWPPAPAAELYRGRARAPDGRPPADDVLPREARRRAVGDVRLALSRRRQRLRRRRRPGGPRRRDRRHRGAAGLGSHRAGSRPSSACTRSPRHDRARRQHRQRAQPAPGRPPPARASSPRTARPRASRSTSRSSTTPSAWSARCFPRRTGVARRELPGVLPPRGLARGLDQEVQFLSGGNQQKVVLARWLSIEPARGADGRAHPRHRRRRQARGLRADARAGRPRASRS